MKDTQHLAGINNELDVLQHDTHHKANDESLCDIVVFNEV